MEPSLKRQAFARTRQEEKEIIPKFKHYDKIQEAKKAPPKAKKKVAEPIKEVKKEPLSPIQRRHKAHNKQ